MIAVIFFTYPVVAFLDVVLGDSCVFHGRWLDHIGLRDDIHLNCFSGSQL